VADKITACFLCPCNCGLIMTLGPDLRIERIQGDKENPRTRGFCCPKGRHQAEHIDSPHRLTRPLKRVNGRLEETSWEDALEGVARGLLAVRKRHGARAVGLACGGSPHPMLQNMIAYLFLRSLGSRNMYSPVSLEFTGKYTANQKMFGCSFFEGYPDFEHARFILLVGTNPAVSHPLDAVELRRAARDPDRTVAVVDPRRTETARMADPYVAIRPSTDIYLLASMLHVILSEGLHDAAFTARHARGVREVARTVSRFTPEAVHPVTGIDPETTRRLARGFAGTRPGLIFYDMGVIANRHATLVSWAVKTLMLVTGNLGVKGSVLFNPTLVNSNVTERFAFSGKKYASRPRGYPEITGHMPVTELPDEILLPGEGQIRAMIVCGCNPLRAYTSSAKSERAFGELGLLVSIDPFLTEVGRMAHYVLPTCSHYEQENISFGFHEMYPTRFVQLTQRIRDPLGQSRNEGDIFFDLSRRMGLPLMNQPLLHHGLRIAARMHRLRGNRRPFDVQGALFRLLARAGGTSWAELKARPHGFDLGGGASCDMMAEIRTPGKKACLDVPEFRLALQALDLNPPRGDAEYPLVLSTTCRTWANLNTLYRDETWIREHAAENRLQMNPGDAGALGLSDGDRARLATRSGEGIVPVSVSEDVSPGCVFLSHGWGLSARDPEAAPGEVRGVDAARFLSDGEGDLFSGMPFYSGVPCRVESRREGRRGPATGGRRLRRPGPGTSGEP